MHLTSLRFALGLLAAFLAGASSSADEPLRANSEKSQVVITRGSSAVLKYVFRDEQILRPFFTALHAPGGIEVTRRHPPREGIDATDHATMHPGLWLAFGALSDADFWRNKGRVEHDEFIQDPAVTDGVVRFKVRNRYVDQQRLVCQEEAAFMLKPLREGYLLTWDSTFSGSEPIVFGDQEEMGLGMRLATPLCVKGGTGAITDSDGRRNEKEIWGKQPRWCDYSGTMDGSRAGILLAGHPENFRPAWMHARDYGLLVANPFGRKAFQGGEASRVEVKPGEKLRLRFGIWIYSCAAEETPDLAAVAAEYSRRGVSANSPR